jgi:hypothetical protein
MLIFCFSLRFRPSTLVLGIYALIKLTQNSKVHVLDKEFTPFFEETTMLLNRGLWLSYLYKSHLSLSLSLSLMKSAHKLVFDCIEDVENSFCGRRVIFIFFSSVFTLNHE